MKRHILLITTILILIPVYSYAQAKAKYVEDEKAIRQVVQNLDDGWKNADAEKWADQFTDDVDFTVWNGMYLSGREANLKGHEYIWNTIYKGTEIRTEIKKIRFLADNVAVVHLHSKMFIDNKQKENSLTVVPLLVLKKEGGKWKIAVFQNTPIINEGDLVVGRAKEIKEKK